MKTLCFTLLFFMFLARAGSDPWQASDLIPASSLAAKLPDHPKVFYVGFNVLYRGKHVPGSQFAGPGTKPEGLKKLLESVRGLDKSTQIILYCGCCPFDQCPNVRPAFRALRDAGFQDVKVVTIPENFAKDWVEKGYPVEGRQGL